MTRLRAWCGVLALTLSAAAFAAGQAPVLVLESADRSAYSQVAASFAAVLQGTVEEQRVGESGTVQTDSKPSMVLAIGPTAATAAKRAFSGVPIVFCMVPYYERYGLEGPNVTGIAMTPDVSLQLAAIRALSPSAKRVGVLHDPRYSTQVVELARAKAKDHGMTVVPLEVDAESRAARVLDGASGKVDALLMVADKTVATAAVVRALIAFADDEKIPLVALSASQVKEGAILSLSAGPASIGAQAGRLANRIIHEKVDPGALAVAQPDELELALNLTAARKHGGSGEGGASALLDLLRFAARRSFPVRIFE